MYTVRCLFKCGKIADKANRSKSLISFINNHSIPEPYDQSSFDIPVVRPKRTFR